VADQETHDAKPYIDEAMRLIGASDVGYPGLSRYIFQALCVYQIRVELPPREIMSPSEIKEQISTLAKAASAIEGGLRALKLQSQSASAQGGPRSDELAEICWATVDIFGREERGDAISIELVPEQRFARIAADLKALCGQIGSERLRRPRNSRAIQAAVAIQMLGTAYQVATGRRPAANPPHRGPFVRFVAAAWRAISDRPMSPKEIREALLDDRAQFIPFTPR
jgi:hypothetical protein